MQPVELLCWLWHLYLVSLALSFTQKQTRSFVSSQHAVLCPPPTSLSFLLISFCSLSPAPVSPCFWLTPSQHSLLSAVALLSSIFTPVTLLIPFTGVWLRCCEWVRMAVSRSNPWGLAFIFASFSGQCFSIQSLSLAIIKPLAVTWDKTACPSATQTHYTPFLLPLEGIVQQLVRFHMQRSNRDDYWKGTVLV